jgi:hypothetical protein
MKNLKQSGLLVLDADQLQQIQGGVIEGGCIPPIKFPIPYPYPPIKPWPPIVFPSDRPIPA